MFRELILKALHSGRKTTKELYATARERQPRDCHGPTCPHRHQPSDMEWQHELRREQYRVQGEGLIERSGNFWKLKKSD